MIDLLSITFIVYKILDSNDIKRPKSMSLKSVAEFFNINREDEKHNALEDAEITYLCFKEYMKFASGIKL